MRPSGVKGRNIENSVFDEVAVYMREKGRGISGFYNSVNWEAF